MDIDSLCRVYYKITPWSVSNRHLALHLCKVWVGSFEHNLLSCIAVRATEGWITACFLRSHILVFEGVLNLQKAFNSLHADYAIAGKFPTRNNWCTCLIRSYRSIEERGECHLACKRRQDRVNEKKRQQSLLLTANEELMGRLDVVKAGYW